ncbi:Prefoldin alpha-like protein [Rhizoclosmatium globosum]|uniref:Prefoldin alpha-like protein n=1 Tax=Rhizoclosmatium globosum TaxID=329046 RepID=A0A1Y2B094_9FUNG|nr:Prefoldin alpha-like protein [Rhizoclosmatium globosum]|eukprot:ORY28241.1 Prefoldin alpha-like protein [Rhizoclosmatium globosum]
MEQAEKQQKIQKYEVFLSTKLQPDLKKVLDERDAVYEDIAEYLKLKNQIEFMKENSSDDSPLKTLVDVGCDFYMQAKVENKDRIYIQVGLDCHVEFSLDEALMFLGRKEKQLEKKAESLTERALQIKAHIKLCLAAIQEVLDA